MKSSKGGSVEMSTRNFSVLGAPGSNPAILWSTVILDFPFGNLTLRKWELISMRDKYRELIEDIDWDL